MAENAYVYDAIGQFREALDRGASRDELFERFCQLGNRAAQALIVIERNGLTIPDTHDRCWEQWAEARG